MSKTAGSILLTVLLGVVMIGCAGSKLTAIQPFEQKIDQYQAIYFAAEPMVTEDITEEISLLEEQVIAHLNKKEIFETALIGNCNFDCVNTLNVKGVVTAVKKVSGSQRFWGGAFAGKASMTVELTFTDAQTGETVAVYSLTAKSGGTGLSGGTNESVGQTSKAITELILTNHSKGVIKK